MMIFHPGSGTIIDAKECVLTLKDPEDPTFDQNEDTIDFVEALALLINSDDTVPISVTVLETVEEETA